MQKLKVYCEHQSERLTPNGAYAQMFSRNGWEITNSMRDANLLQLEGGADVCPSLYGEDEHPRTHCSKNADDHTSALCSIARQRNIPIAGICRGSQYISVLGGGKLWQHVDGHATGHRHSLLDIETGIIIEDCSSTHHQQHRPSSKAIIIATSFPQLSTRKECMVDGKLYMTTDMDMLNWEYKDIEAFYYPHINALGYQPHPEFFGPDHPCQKYYFDLIAKYLKLRA